jgi:hypothetical protein
MTKQFIKMENSGCPLRQNKQSKLNGDLFSNLKLYSTQTRKKISIIWGHDQSAVQELKPSLAIQIPKKVEN